MNLSHKRIAEIRKLVSAGIQLGRTEAEDMLGHNDHLTELCEARARLVLRAESESETLRGLYQMHQQTETREMRDLKAELAGLKTGYEAYERVNAELRAENEALKKRLAPVDNFNRQQVPVIGYTGCLICGQFTDHGGLPCPKTSATAWASTSKEQSHD